MIKKSKLNELLYFINNISALLLALSTFLILQAYQFVFLSIFIITSFYLPWIKGKVEAKILSIMGISFYLLGSLFFDPLLLISAFLAVIIKLWVELGFAESEDDSPEERSSVDNFEALKYLFASLVSFINPFILIQSFLGLLGNFIAIIRYKGNVPSVNNFEQEVDYQLPFSQEWQVFKGGVTKKHSHSWDDFTQRYAYDFIITSEKDLSYEDEGRELQDYYCYQKPMLSPAEGEVVKVKDGMTEFKNLRRVFLLNFLTTDIRGNHVIIKHAPKEYSLLAHLVPGSIMVEEGDKVAKGEKIARCGNSGYSSEPHLHFQVQDSPNFYFAVSLPIKFSQLKINGEFNKQSYIRGQYQVENN